MKRKVIKIAVLTGMMLSIVLNPITAYQQSLFSPENQLNEEVESGSVPSIETEENPLNEEVDSESVPSIEIEEQLPSEEVESEGAASIETDVDKKLTEYKEKSETYDTDSEEVKALVKLLNQLTFDELLVEYGGRVSSGKLNNQGQHVPVPKEEEDIDRYQLDDAFKNLQQNGEQFVVDVLNHFSEYKPNEGSSEEIIGAFQKDLNSLVLIKVYFDRWYNIEINNQNLSNQLYFKQASNKDILEIAEKIKNKPSFLQSNLTGLRYRETLQPYYGFDNVPELVEAFISKETGKTNYDEWFHTYFKGTIYEVKSKYASLNLSTWDKIKDNLNMTSSSNESADGTDNLLLPLLMVKHSEGLVLGNTPGLIIYSSKKNYGENVDKALGQTLENFKSHLELLLDTHKEDQRRELLDKLKTVPVFDSDRYEYDINGVLQRKFNYLDPTNILSHEFYLAIGFTKNIARGSGVNASATPQGITFVVAKLTEQSGGTLAHEYNHSTSHLILQTKIDRTSYGYRKKISVESIPTRINNSPYYWEGLPWVTYESEGYPDHTKDPLANSSNRFTKPEDLQEYFGGYTNLVNIMNQVVAEVVLKMPVEEQVGYIRKWTGDADQIIITLSKNEIEALKLKTLDDLVDNKLAIVDKSVSDGPAGLVMYGESFYTRYSLYYAEKEGADYLETGDSVELFDTLMSLPQHTGWDAVQQFFSSATGVESHLDALRLVTGDPSMDFVKFKKMKLHENEDRVKKNGLKDHSYDDLVTLFQTNPTKFAKVKTDIYKHYMAETSEFRTSIFSDEPEPAKTYGNFKLGYWNAKKNATIEGQAGLDGEKFETSDSVEKYIEIVDKEGSVLSRKKATNTNWYDKTNYDGYQVQLGEKELATLASGDYLLQVVIVYKESETTLPIQEPKVSRSINQYSSTINGINGYTINKKFINFSSVNEKCVLSVHPVSEGINRLFEYNGKENARIYDGWINTEYDFNRKHTKELVIKDSDGKEVYRKLGGNWNINKQYNLGVIETLANSGFQIMVPENYRSDSYKKYVVIKEEKKEVGNYELSGSK